MNRWLVWFGIGAATIVLLFLTDNKHPDTAVFALPFFGWLFITFFAVPISIVYWLVKGRRAN